MAAQRRKSTGRKKIEIKRLEVEEARQVSFSKRRTGLFNKARELAILCNLDVAAVAFSPSGAKAFSFGHPSVDSVLDRFLPSNYPPWGHVAMAAGGGDPNLQVLAELNRQQGELLAQLNAEKARRDALRELAAKERADGCKAAAWVDTEVSQMGQEDLVAFDAALAKMQAAVEAHANKLIQETVHVGTMVHGGGGGGEFDLGGGGTWAANNGMEIMQQHQQGFPAGMEMMPMPMPMQQQQQQGFPAGMEMMPMPMQQQQQQQQGFPAGMEMMPMPMQQQQQQQQQGFPAGMEMMPMPMQQQQQQGFPAGMEMMPMPMPMQQQQQQMLVPLPPVFPGGMEMVPHQWFGRSPLIPFERIPPVRG